MSKPVHAVMVEMGETFHRGQTRPWRTDYRTVGPDGTVFTNTAKGTLESVMRRQYPALKLVFEYVKGPGWRARP